MAPHIPRRSARRAGISLVEVLVSVVLLGVGLLGVAGSSAIAVRGSSAAARERRAVQRAADRAAWLRAQGCAMAVPGTLADPASALTERWSVGTSSGASVPFDVEVRWRAPSGLRVVTLRSGILC